MTANVIQSLEEILEMKRNGSYTESDGAVLITRDADTGILTLSFHGVDNEEGNEIFEEAARRKGLVKMQ